LCIEEVMLGRENKSAVILQHKENILQNNKKDKER
jgi:hypothetical protein